jgi:tetratricopeptide (TPR) repeat protein
MFDIFINYRTADARYGAAATYELLSERFGKERIFLDNQSMPPGANYPAALQDALESMRVLLVLIGPQWLAADPADGRSPIHRDDDWVRREIRYALERPVPIVPVLLDGTTLPDPGDLPDDVTRLVYHQAVEVRHLYLGEDVGRLAERLAGVVTPPVAARSVVPRQLLADSGHFVGREDQLERLNALLHQASAAGPAIAILSGTAGVGKTGLGVHWAHLVADEFPDGQLYVDLRGYDTERPMEPAEALARLLRALGVARPEEIVSVEERAGHFRTLLSDRRVLIILDNVRSVDQVRLLLPGGGPSAVVITSRHRLEGLAVRHAPVQLELSPLPDSEAVDLLREIVGDRVAAEPGAASKLVAQCSALPLALRIVAERAARRPSLPLSELAGELADERARLDVLDTGDPHSTVRTVFSWSYQGLTDQAATAFRAIGAHPGQSFDIATVAAMTASSQSTAAAMVRALAEAHLLAAPEHDRFAMHDLLRSYARELAAASGERTLRRLFDHYVHSTDRADRLLTPHRFRIAPAGDAEAGVRFADVDAARRWLATELPTLVALCQVDDVEFDEYRWQLAYLLRGYFYLTKDLDSWVETHAQALAACLRAGDRKAEALTRNNFGMALMACGRLDEAMVHYEQAERLFTMADDEHGLSNALANQASVLRRRGSYEEALRRQRQALACYRRTGAQRNAGITLRSMAWAELAAGRTGAAVRCAEEATDIAVGLGHMLDIAQAFNALGVLHHRAGDPAKAEVALHQAIEFSERCESRYELAKATRQLGRLALDTGRTVEAQGWWRTALGLYQEMGATDAAVIAEDLARLTGPW